MEWILSPVNSSNYIMDDRLTYARASILVTYETASGRRYVKQVECYHGRVNKKIGGRLIAWMFSPEPYKGNPALTGKAQCRQCRKYHDFPGCLGCVMDDGICCEGFIQYEPTKAEAESNAPLSAKHHDDRGGDLS